MENQHRAFHKLEAARDEQTNATELNKLLQKELQKKENWIRTLRDDLRIQDNLKAKLHLEHGEEKGELEAQGKAMQLSINTLRSDQKDLNVENRALNTSLQWQNTGISANEDDALKRYTTTLLQEQKKLTGELKLLKQVNQHATKSKESHDKAKLKLDSELSELQRVNNDLQKGQKAFSVKNKKLQAINAKLRADVHTMQRCTDVLGEGKKRLSHENDELKKQAMESKDQEEIHVAKLHENHREENTKLHAEICAIQASKRLFMEEKGVLARKHGELQKRIKNAKYQEKINAAALEELKTSHAKVKQNLEAEIEVLKKDTSQVVLQKNTEFTSLRSSC
jgi:hypothetical protein